MFNKNLFVIFVFLLFILQISFVNALSDNQTEIINNSTESIEYSEINNFHSQNFENKIESENYTDKIEFNQGDIIPIHIDSSSDGQLKVLVDDNEYGIWNFTKNEIIYIPTYNPESFYNNSKLNIDVGLHNISLKFNFKNFISKNNTAHIENSNLSFKFNENNNSHINTYTYKSTLNILKKDSTIHILNFSYYNLCEKGRYKIHIDNLDLWYDENIYDEILNNLYGILIINNNKLIYKESCNDMLVDEYDELLEIYKVGIYNFTVINFIDGTMDSVLFKANKYQPKLEIIPIVNGTSININIIIPQLEYYNVWASINIDNITKHLMIYGKYGEYIDYVSFENLSSGIHTLKIYCSGDNISEDFNYTTSFEIEAVLDLDNKNQYNIDQNTSNDKNLSFIKENTLLSNITKNINVIKNHNTDKNSHSKKLNWNSKEIIINSLIGGDKITQSNSNSQTKNSHEIIKKSNSKSINGIQPYQIIILVIILLMIGYFKFSEKNIKKEE